MTAAERWSGNGVAATERRELRERYRQVVMALAGADMLIAHQQRELEMLRRLLKEAADCQSGEIA
jgi:2-methylisocitrate lyase-like PEP mutase family enzyme